MPKNYVPDNQYITYFLPFGLVREVSGFDLMLFDIIQQKKRYKLKNW